MAVSSFCTRWVFPAAVAGLAFGYTGCSEKHDGGSTTRPPDSSPTDYQASGTVTTSSAGTVETNSGARLQVPRFAVPPTDGGAPGTMVFSIERDDPIAPGLVSGKTVASDVYLFGPDGFTFGEMLSLTLPVGSDQNGKNVELYRINQTTGEAEPYGGTFDAEARTITTQTFRLSPWFVAVSDPTSQAWGAFKVANLSSTKWLHLCVQSVDLKYPDADTAFDPQQAQSAWAPPGDLGWTNSGLWHLPQGTYDLCVSMNEMGTIMQPPGNPQRWFLRGIRLDEPWTSTDPITTEITVSQAPATAEDLPCECMPQSSTSVGTGDVQVTLTWHNETACDLDLWVTDPTGATCSWMNPRTSSGGALDRDNLCGSYVDGRPENIFWSNAPSGTYTVRVNFFSDCASNLTSMDFSVRVVSSGSARTYDGTVAAE